MHIVGKLFRAGSPWVFFSPPPRYVPHRAPLNPLPLFSSGELCEIIVPYNKCLVYIPTGLFTGYFFNELPLSSIKTIAILLLLSV